MSEIARVLYDLGILSIVLLLGVFLRKKVRFLQNLYIPASLLGGFCGLMLGPQSMLNTPYEEDEGKANAGNVFIPASALAG